MVNFSLEVTLNEDDLKCLKMSIVIRLNIFNMKAFLSKHIPSRQISNVHYHLVLPYVLSQFVINPSHFVIPLAVCNKPYRTL